MTLGWTAALASGAIALSILFGWLGARPAKALAKPRLVPWRLMMLLAFALTVIALGHGVALLKSR